MVNYKIKTANGSVYIVDLEKRTLTRNGKLIDILNGNVNIISLKQKEQINTQGSYNNLFNYKIFPPSPIFTNPYTNAYKIIFQEANKTLSCSSEITNIEPL